MQLYGKTTSHELQLARERYPEESTFIPSTDSGLELRSFGDTHASFFVNDDGAAVVVELWTAPHARGRGSAVKLLRLLNEFESEGPLQIIANHDAAPYYEKLGYRHLTNNVFVFAPTAPPAPTL